MNMDMESQIPFAGQEPVLQAVCGQTGLSDITQVTLHSISSCIDHPRQGMNKRTVANSTASDGTFTVVIILSSVQLAGSIHHS